MCGIYGHIKTKGKKNSVRICIDGLKRLEYRGYDSAGIAGICEGKIVSFKTVGKVHLLDETVRKQKLSLEMAIAHTRWATHGECTEINAHPHFDANQSIALVHNGIIENYQKLKTQLQKKGIHFRSETDTEVVSQLIGYHYQGDLYTSVKESLKELEGAFAIAFIHKDHPNKIVTAIRSCPLIIGICQKTKDIYLSSDSNAFVNSSLDIFYLNDDEFAIISPEMIEVYNKHGNKLTKQMEKLDYENQSISKEGYEHYLLKEIHEQPKSIEHSLQGRFDLERGTAIFNELKMNPLLLKKIDRILILACGSSYHAGCIGKLFFESYAKIPTTVEIASEFRYQDILLSPQTLVIPISQSGETADTLAATKAAKTHKVPTLGLCNVKNSSLSRFVDSTLWLKAGPEISVCSTKAFTSQLTLLYLLALKLGRERTLTLSQGREALLNLEKLPFIISRVLVKEKSIQALAQKYASFKEFFFIGRKHMFATCLESALKLKEISYLNATGYPAGEMKHGPIALISKELATVAFVGNLATYDKLISNLMEIKARGGPLAAFAPEGHSDIESITKDIIYLPNNLSDELAPIPYSVAGQLFAYHIARVLKTDIDQPRNLAKSVTVE